MPKRQRIEPTKGDHRYIRRDDQGRFDEVEDVGRASPQDQRWKAKTQSKPGQGDNVKP